MTTSSQIYLKNVSVSITIGFSDHNLIAIKRKTKVPKAPSLIIHKRSYKHFNQELFLNDVKRVNWSNVCQEEDPEVALGCFMSLFMQIVNKHAPVRKTTVRANGAPWLGNDLKSLMKQRDQAKQLAELSGVLSDRLTYCKLRNQVTKINRSSKKEYYQNKINDSKNDSKQLWKILNQIMGRSSQQTHSFIEINGAFLTKPVDIANYFNNYFTSKVENLRAIMTPSDGSSSCALIENYIMKEKNCQFDFMEVTISDIVKLLSLLPCDKPAGTDMLDSKLLRIASCYVSSPICHIFNKCFKYGVFPKAWKEAKIIPLPKDKKKDFTGTNSRPISILPVLSKLMEKVVFKQIQDYFIKNKLITNSQHAYRHGHSTATALAQLTDDWMTQIDIKKMAGTVLLDFSAAFDVIDHNIMIAKLSKYRLSSLALDWMKSYLMERSQRVFFNGSLSDRQYNNCGVPQGSCLGPLLFIIFTNELPHVTKNTNMVMYADDTTLYSSASTINELAISLNQDLERVSNWVRENKLALNVTKTKSIVFGSRYMLADDPQLHLSMSGTPIEQVKKTKLLGVLLDSQLSWSGHIDCIITKMGRGLAMVRKCSTYLTPSVMGQVIQSLVFCHLYYCPVIWSAANISDLNKLQLVQNRAARLALNCSTRTNIVFMHTRLSWLSVEQKLLCSLLIFFRNITLNHTPDYFYEQFLKATITHNYNTRNACLGQLTLPAPKTNSQKHTVIYRSLSSWNMLPPHIKLTQNKLSFKIALKAHVLYHS